MDYVTQAEVARRIGVSKMAITQAIQRGRIVEAIVRDADGKTLGLNPEIAIREFGANTDPARKPVSLNGGRPRDDGTPARRHTPAGPTPDQGSGGDNPAESFAKARAEKEHYAAALAKLEYEKAVGLVVDAEEIGQAWVQLVTEAKTRMLALPSQAKAQLPHLTKGDVRLIEDLVRQALEGLATWQPPEV